jgi:hypothetical protein
MFKNLQETIKALNADVNNVANSDKAKKLRKKLLSIGLPIAVVGFLGAFVCFILYVTAGDAAFGENGFTARLLVPFFLIVPCAIIGSIGAMIASYGFRIAVTGYTANLINETVGSVCYNCGETVAPNAGFCSKCGAKLIKKCPNCESVNSYKSEYCSNCGTKLD